MGTGRALSSLLMPSRFKCAPRTLACSRQGTAASGSRGHPPVVLAVEQEQGQPPERGLTVLVDTCSLVQLQERASAHVLQQQG